MTYCLYLPGFDFQNTAPGNLAIAPISSIDVGVNQITTITPTITGQSGPVTCTWSGLPDDWYTNPNDFEYGVNYAWEQFGQDFQTHPSFGILNEATLINLFTTACQEMNEVSATRLRWWLCTDGRAMQWSGQTISGIDSEVVDRVGQVLDIAEEYCVKLVLTLWSFELPGPVNTGAGSNAGGHQSFVSSSANTQTFIDNYLSVLVNGIAPSGTRIGDHPALIIDIYNEPELSQNVTRAQLQRFVAQHAAYLQANTSVPITLGSHHIGRLTGNTAAVSTADGPWWDDATLGSYVSGAFLTYYEAHHYIEFGQTNENPENVPASTFDKPVFIGETAIVSLSQSRITNIINQGYIGVSGWNYDGDGNVGGQDWFDLKPRYAAVNLSHRQHTQGNSCSLTGTSCIRGSYTVTVTATDGTETVSETFTLNVDTGNPPANQAPNITVTNQFTTIGNTVSYSPNVVDPDGDTYTCAASGMPAGITFNGTTFSGTPTTAGTSTVTITCTDTNNNSSVQTFTWTINSVVTGAQWYVDSNTAGTSANLGTQNDPWTEFDQIDYGAIDGSSDKEVFIVGGSGQVYNTTLAPTGSVQKFTVINGPIEHTGPRPSLLPQSGQPNPVTYSDDGGHAIDCDGVTDVVFDGSQWQWWLISKWQSNAISFNGSSARITLRNMELWDNGIVGSTTGYDTNNQICGGSYTLYSSSTVAAAPNGAAIRVGGDNHLFEKLIINSNGCDAIQSQHNTPTNNLTINLCWLGNGRVNTRPTGTNTGGSLNNINGSGAGPFSTSCHSDGVHIFSGGAQSGLTITNSIIFNVNNGILTVESFNGTSMANQTLDNVLLINTENNSILSGTGIAQNNMSLNRVTMYSINLQQHFIQGGAGSTGWSINNTLAGSAGSLWSCRDINMFGHGSISGGNNFADNDIVFGTGAGAIFTHQNINFNSPPVDYTDMSFDLTPTNLANPSAFATGTIAGMLGVTSVSAINGATGRFTITP
jgi:hypothetical protein